MVGPVAAPGSQEYHPRRILFTGADQPLVASSPRTTRQGRACSESNNQKCSKSEPAPRGAERQYQYDETSATLPFKSRPPGTDSRAIEEAGATTTSRPLPLPAAPRPTGRLWAKRRPEAAVA
jgi:hypothetical protein